MAVYQTGRYRCLALLVSSYMDGNNIKQPLPLPEAGSVYGEFSNAVFAVNIRP